MIHCDRSVLLFDRLLRFGRLLRNSVILLLRNAAILLLFFIPAVPSCRLRGTEPGNHSIYFEQAFRKADSMGADRKEQAFAYLDSVYNAIPDAGPDDLYKKYDYKRNYFYETRKEY